MVTRARAFLDTEFKNLPWTGETATCCGSASPTKRKRSCRVRSTRTSTWRAPSGFTLRVVVPRMSANEPAPRASPDSSRRQSLKSCRQTGRVLGLAPNGRSAPGTRSRRAGRSPRATSPLLGLGLPAVAGGGRAVAGDVAERPVATGKACTIAAGLVLPSVPRGAHHPRFDALWNRQGVGLARASSPSGWGDQPVPVRSSSTSPHIADQPALEGVKARHYPRDTRTLTSRHSGALLMRRCRSPGPAGRQPSSCAMHTCGPTSMSSCSASTAAPPATAGSCSTASSSSPSPTSRCATATSSSTRAPSRTRQPDAPAGATRRHSSGREPADLGERLTWTTPVASVPLIAP